MVDTRGTETSAAPPRPRSTARKPLFQHPGRVAIVVIALLAVLNLGVILLHSSDTSPGGRAPLPAAVESVAPLPGSIAGPIDTVTVDLNDSLTGVLLIKQDGRYVEIPEDQLDRVVELGQVSFRPGPDKEITKLAPGTNDVLVYYWSRTRVGGRPAHPASYAWSFQVKA